MQIGAANNTEFQTKFSKNQDTLLSILIRKWITEKIFDYQEFLKKWEGKYFRQLICVKLVKQLTRFQTSITDADIEIKESAIVIRDQLLKVMEELINTSKCVPRPECVKNKNLQLSYLSEMQLNETSFSEIFSGLTNIIEINIDEALKVIPIFEKYAYLFKDIVRERVFGISMYRMIA